MTFTIATAPPVRQASRRIAPQHARTSRAGDLLRWSVRFTSSLVLAIAALTFLGLAVGPHLLDYRTETMLTGSMAPDIEPGDVVIAVPEPAADVLVGDILSYRIPVGDHRVETHRVIEVLTDASGSLAVRTKGDANAGADPWTAVLEGDTVWQVKGSVPYVGDAIRLLRAPVLSTVLLYGTPAVLVLWLLAGIWRRPAQDQES